MAIVRGVSNERADEAAESLYKGGVRLIEVTLNTPGALGIIERWRGLFAGRMRVGAGTVLDASMAQAAIDAGAEFLGCPHVDESAISHGRGRGAEVFPGALTPTEVVRAWQAGATAVKLFPASALGPKYLQELRGPLGEIPLVAVGGIKPEDLSDFLRAGAVGVGLGGSLVDAKLLEQGRFDALQVLARRCVDAARGGDS
jgi:2-dehydro-3-deoxyphosphogluconate aldolase/(4S)-4-hydroxy-2-oxoglutarate aldolase